MTGRVRWVGAAIYINLLLTFINALAAFGGLPLLSIFSGVVCFSAALWHALWAYPDALRDALRDRDCKRAYLN